MTKNPRNPFNVSRQQSIPGGSSDELDCHTGTQGSEFTQAQKIFSSGILGNSLWGWWSVFSTLSLFVFFIFFTLTTYICFFAPTISSIYYYYIYSFY